MTESNTATLDLTTPEGVKSLMATSKSEDDWNRNCDNIKKVHQGQYPSFWYKEIVMSGFSNKIAATFGRNMNVNVKEVSL